MRSSSSQLVGRNSYNATRIMLAAACIATIAQTSFAGTISTSASAPATADISQADFSASGGQYIGWQDYSDNNTSPGGPGQSFIPAANLVLNSLTIKGVGSAGGGVNAATWTISISSNPDYDGWGSQAKPDGNAFTSASETFTGDATASGNDGYVTFNFSTPLSLLGGSRYAWTLHTDAGYFGLAKSSTDVYADGKAYMPNSALTLEWNQDGNDRTFFINGGGVVIPTDSEWITDGNEAWANGANWTPTGVPSGASGTKVTFATNGGAITTVAQIVVDVAAGVNVPKIVFNKGDGGYLLSGTGAVTATQGIDVLLGSHTISVPTSINSGGVVTVAAGSSLTLANVTIPGFGSFTKEGDGSLTVDKLQNCSVNINGGAVTMSPGNGQADGFIYSLSLNNGSTLNLNDNLLTVNGIYGNGTLNIGAGGRVKCALYDNPNFAGTLTGAGDLTVGDLSSAQVHTATFTGPMSHTGATTVEVGNLVTNNGIKSGNTVTINNGSKLEIVANGGTAAVTSIGALTLSGAGSHVELHDNDLVMNYGAGPSTYTDTVNQVKSGLVLLGGAGTDGITSVEVDAQTVPGTVLAVVDDGDPNIAGGITAISGYAIPNPTTSVLVKYTWFGDANLDGMVDGADYALTDTGFTSGGSLGGWVFGDYDYNGIVDGGDYALQDTGFIAQTGTLPEPAALSLLGLGALAMLKRNRRNNKLF